MADTVFGIYGFDFSKRFTVSQAELVPCHGFPECQSLAQDRTHLFLTGYGILPESRASADIDQSAFVRRLADGMTFHQQQMVIPTRLTQISAGDSIAQMITSGRLPESLPILSDRHTPGAAIGNDTFYPGSRTLFLELFLAHTERASADHPLTAAFYRQIEIWKLSQPYVEIEYFLAFSGLEILARAYGAKPNNRSIAVPLSGFLRSHGFAVSQALAQDWADARNALFLAANSKQRRAAQATWSEPRINSMRSERCLPTYRSSSWALTMATSTGLAGRTVCPSGEGEQPLVVGRSPDSQCTMNEPE